MVLKAALTILTHSETIFSNRNLVLEAKVETDYVFAFFFFF